MDSARSASEKFEIEIKENAYYNRAWLLENWPGMHDHRLSDLQKNFGLIPVNSGNRHAIYLFRGKNFMEALERESLARIGNSISENCD